MIGLLLTAFADRLDWRPGPLPLPSFIAAGGWAIGLVDGALLASLVWSIAT